MLSCVHSCKTPRNFLGNCQELHNKVDPLSLVHVTSSILVAREDTISIYSQFDTVDRQIIYRHVIMCICRYYSGGKAIFAVCSNGGEHFISPFSMLP
jgi:hypothetical protein